MWKLMNLGAAADRIRTHPEINDVAAVTTPDGRLVVLVERQGLVYGPWARDIVIDELAAAGLAADASAIVVAITGAVPRDSDGAEDVDACVGVAAKAIANPAWTFDFAPPVTDMENAIAAMLEDLLPIKRLSMTDNLPLVGADSLVLVELSVRISERFAVSIEAMDLFESDTVRALAALVASRMPSPATPSAD